METETDRLKHSTEMARVEQTLNQIRDYTDQTFSELIEQKRKRSSWFKLEMAAFAVNVVTLFIAPEWLHFVALTVWLITFIVGVNLERTLARINGRIDALYRMHVILGMVEEEDEDTRPKTKSRKKKESKIAAKWEALKAKMRREAYV